MKRKMGFLQLIALLVVSMCSPLMADVSLEDLIPDQNIEGFSVANLYLDGTDKVMGARFLSERYGFILDVMRVQSVPQAFLWIKTAPESDQGLPHTCEHLLLGKGNRGRYVAALEQMSLSRSTAYTGQVRTCYHFNTIAGEETFYQILEAKLLAFLQPDFTDEEIRREVCHVGVTEDAQTGALSLEEKGTVYTEMVSSFEKPGYYYYNAMRSMLYGQGHPLSNVAGGTPQALRTVTPEDFWRFHRKTHHLANMGMIVSIASDISVESFLRRMSAILRTCQPMPTSSQYVGIGHYPLPAPRPAPYGSIQLVSYPSESDQDPGEMHFCWPAHLTLDNRQSLLLSLFLAAFSDGPTSNLYDLFINSETRKIDLGGNNVWSWAPIHQGRPIWIALEGLGNAHITEQMVDSVRTLIRDEIQRIYDLPDGSKDLLDFNREVESHLVQLRKEKEDYLNSPPLFGFRGGPAGGWESNVEFLEKDSGFRKSLVLKGHFAHAESALALGTNIWRDVMDTCRLLSTIPYAVGSYPDVNMVTHMRRAKEDRLIGYIADLKKKYGLDGEQEAILRFKGEFDRQTSELERIAAHQELPGFIDNPPMSLDDQLKYETIVLPGSVPLVASTFDNMSSATVGIALRLDVIPESLLVYVPFLPHVLTAIGVVEDGQVVPYEQMQERLRQEVLRLSCDFDHGLETGRIELVLSAAGSNLDELKNALRWMGLSLYSPYLSTDNLPRMTDLVDQTLISLRNKMKGAEEGWVRYPADAYRFQANPLFLSTNSFLTKTHHLHRLRCLLTAPGSEEDQRDLAGCIDALAVWGQDKGRDEMMDLLTALADASADQEVAADFEPRLTDLTAVAMANAQLVIKAIKASLPEIPDADLPDDWAYLCRQAKGDIAVIPDRALDDIKMILRLICRADNARLYMISNSDDRRAAWERIEDLVARLDHERGSVRLEYDPTERILERLRTRLPDVGRPVYVGLISEGTTNGVLIHSAEYAAEYDTTANGVLDCLAGKLFSGAGAHGLFMRTWSAGLAYSNGISVNAATGRVGYYAERCPDVAETMRFVVDELKNARKDPSLTDYTISQVFGRSRAAQRYEARGEAMGADLADGYTPERVAAFRSKVLKVREMDGFYEDITRRMEKVYGQVLIGYGEPLAASSDGYFFLIGPQTQFESLENYIASSEGKQTIVRLYPRDYWLVGGS